MGPRHWTLLALLAEYATLDTNEVAKLMFGSRPAAARHLNVLVRAGLVWRFVYDTDSTHRAHYEVSTTGVRLLADRLHRAGEPVPPNLASAQPDQLMVNNLVVGLTQAAKASQGRSWLYGWRRGVDATIWLHSRGVTGVQPRAAGIWLQDGLAARFLLHIDDGVSAPRLAQMLDGYRHSRAGVPAGCILMLTMTGSRETELHEDLLNAPLPVPVATATFDRLNKASDASAPIWTLTGDTTRLVRLIDTVGNYHRPTGAADLKPPR